MDIGFFDASSVHGIKPCLDPLGAGVAAGR
jgi:hypothetical protein